MKKWIILWTAALCCAFEMNAKVELPRMFQNGMVLQRNKPIPVWGHADAGEDITVTLNKKKVQTTAGSDGRWRVDLPQMKAGGPYELTVNDVTISNVLIGDVWLLSGQSNIDVTIERVYPWYTKDIDSYENPQIRLFRVQNQTDTHGVRNDIGATNINWKPVNKENAWFFSAAGYFLGRRMFEKSNVPQGIIVNSWGGTPIEAWISADSLSREFPMLVERTRLYQSDDYVRSQQMANMRMNNQWSMLLNEKDPGMKNTKVGGETSDVCPLFTALGYDDSQWQKVEQFSMEWAKIGGRGIVGSIWLRQHVTIDKAHAGKPARLLLGTLFDSDVTFVNGRQVGSTGYQYPPRRYDLPEGLLREGDNVITIRFINKYGIAHFIPEKPYLIAFGDDRLSINPMPADVIPLSTTWLHHAGAEMPSCPSADVSLQNLPTTLYNAVLYPLAPYALSGIVWYQGESNVGNPRPYERYLTMMINNWRALWQQPELPFVVVQLANYDGRQQTGNPSPIKPQLTPQNSNWAQLREAQRLVAKKLDNVALASAIDLGETVDIHPLRKREVAERIGLCFDRTVYHDNKVKLMPEIVSTAVEGNAIILTFDQALRPCAELYEFEVAVTSSPAFHNAQARADGNRIIITSPVEGTPSRVRHAWKDNPTRLNAYSQTGLPVGPFEITL
ncbi:MAG: sialate O-acetylesterase [Prevotella sp.]|nr:sialate O-acetylesterase [Prevotella sp.]